MSKNYNLKGYASLKKQPQNYSRDADLCLGDFMSGQFHHGKVSLAQRADDFVEADLQGSSLGRAGLSPLGALCQDHHGASTVWSYSVGIGLG